MAWAGAGPRLREVGPVWAVRCDAACRRGGWSALFVVLGLLLLLPSNLLFVSSTLDATRTNNRAKVYQALMPPFYLPEAELQAIEWMGDNLPPDAVIGCLPMVGSYLPGLIGRTVYCGHWAETIHFADKLQAYSRFLKEPGLAAEKVAFLRQAGITHLYFGAYELEHTGGQLPQFPHLERVYPPAQEEALALPALLRLLPVQ